MKISIKWAMLLTGLYIMIPIMLFLVWWTHVSIGFFVSACILSVLFTQANKLKREYVSIAPKTGGIVSVILIAWTLLSGAGHRGVFNGDYFKHNVILNDLITLSWPVHYNLKETGDTLYLVYYFAYYLPSALIGKWWGWQVGNIALFTWTLLGIYLVFFWLFSFINEKKQLWYGVLFPLFSGLDGIGKLVMGRKVVNNEWEWWGRNWQYSGNTTLFFYVPQHALIGWIMMGMILYALIKNKQMPLQLLLLSGTLLWSPFIFIGLVPFYLFMLLKGQLRITKLEVFLGILITVILSLFLSSNLTFSIPETGASGWLWRTERLFGSFTLVRLFLFYVFEFVIFAAFIFSTQFKNQRRTEFILFFIGFALLLLFPWYKGGLMNDFAMRSSVPALYVISYYWLRTVIEIKKVQRMALFTLSLFVIGALYPLILLSNGIRNFSLDSPRFTLTQLETPKIRRQYLGNSTGGLFRMFGGSYNSPTEGAITLRK